VKVKLFNAPINSTIKVDGQVLDFRHVDGMYSLCFDSQGRPVHIAAWAEVEVLDGDNAGSESKNESEVDTE
jgi:hypothetical protein